MPLPIQTRPLGVETGQYQLDKEILADQDDDEEAAN